MAQLYSQMHNLFSTSKTLRFELQPVGKTAQNMARIIAEDEDRAEKFKRVKKYADEAHKAFIEECLKNINKEAVAYYFKRYAECVAEHNDAELERVMDMARKVISDTFTKNRRYKELSGKDLICKTLMSQVADKADKLADVKDFERFTTYFQGYNKNRENMYVKDKKSTAIGHRIVDQNLPTFVKNIAIFAKAADTMPELKENIKNGLGIDTDDLFAKPEQFVNFLAQSGIEHYNLAISGRSEEGNSKIQGINEYINQHNQQNKAILPKLRELYKQILSDKKSSSFVENTIQDDAELIGIIKDIFEKYNQIINDQNRELEKAICNLEAFDLDKIYVNNDISLTALSKSVYGNWSFIAELREKNYDTRYNGKTKRGSEKYAENREKELKKAKNLSLRFIENCVEAFAPELTGKLAKYFAVHYAEYVADIEKTYRKAIPLLEKEYTDKELLKDNEAIAKIKALLDAMKALQDLVRVVIPKDNTLETDDLFYNVLKYDTLAEIIPVYNKARNYLTQKPYSTEKFKINFDCATLLGGWDLNKETANLGVLLEKNGCYYLAVMDKKNNKVFEKYPSDSEDCYKKVEYKFFKDATTMIPKCSTQLNDVKKHFASLSCDYVLSGKNFVKPLRISKEVFDLNNTKYGDCKKFQIGYLQQTNDRDGFNHAVATWVNFCLKFLESYESTTIYDIAMVKQMTFAQLDDFYSKVNKQLYKLTFKDISSAYLHKLVDEGKIYLFKIYSKDFSPFSKGKPNLHTLYWKALFDADNLANVVYKLNGEAEVFYRKHSIKPEITHPKNKPINNRRDETTQSVFDYDLIKDRRYSVDKFLFHVPLTMNFKSRDENNINAVVNNALRSDKDTHLIGIDRGERNLLYISVINGKGEIVEQFSLNEIINEYNSKQFATDYHKLLADREKKRDEARRSWTTVENIKELKEGYMSQVVNKFVKLMLKYNAVIVLEDLNSGFTNSRKKVEKSVYDKFETMLVSKLQYLVNKDAEDKFAEGGVLNAYQLASSAFKHSFQNGVIFYIPAWNTSKIDPTTGFVNMFKLQDITSEATGKEFVAKFKDIRYNGSYFEFDIDYADFSDKVGETRKNWTICSYGQRIRTFRNPAKNSEWDNEEIDLSAEFMKLFARYNIDLNNIQTEIAAKADSKFFKSEGQEGFIGFMRLFKLMTQLRNSVTNSDIDYILSPVKNARGEFFDTRKGDKKLPLDADANGAYNIARKGLMLLDRIRISKPDEKIAYGIKNSEWLEYVQSQDR